MKITIDLTWSEAKGIDDFLHDIYLIKNPSKKDVQEYIATLISLSLHDDNTLVSNYIKRLEPNEKDI